ncbi:MAG: DnaJ domain-containing protein [Ktedonobacterales bacterium]|nr:DnaJ domain-containing protein [Ktedonobacterales bacterium]
MTQPAKGNDPDWYTVLGVAPTVDEEAIRAAYRKLAREHHPDVVGAAGAEMMKRINAAYRVLSDPTRRQAYDQQRGGSQPAPPPARATKRPAPATRSAGPLRLYRALETHDAALVAVALAQRDAMAALGFSDGRVEIWHNETAQRIAALDPGPGRALRPGVLQEVRLSPNGTLAMAWGLNYGIHVWECASGKLLWSASFNGPTGAMDGILIDNPPMVRLATPAAPSALAEEDPFQWVETGRFGSQIWTRPLAGTVTPTWAVPLRCDEPVPQGPAGRNWRVHLRALAWNGETLLTFSTGPASANISNASIVHLWNLRQHGRLGAAGPQRQGSIVIPARALWHPLAVAANGTQLAVLFDSRALRLYDLPTGHHLELPTGDLPAETRMAAAPDGALLALALPDGRAELWATASGQRVQTWEMGAPLTALVFALAAGVPTLALARRDGVCEIWRAG